MKFMLNHLHKQKHLFEPGGKLAWLYPLYEAQETFLFTPADTATSAPHVRDGLDLKRLMITVIIALIPSTLFAIYNAGLQFNTINLGFEPTVMNNWKEGLAIVMPLILVSYIVGGLTEVVFAIIRKHDINEGFLVTGLLFPITLPPTLPLWQAALGIFVGVVIGKEIFGGTGFNVLNPALTGRAFILFCFPVNFSGDVYTKIVDSTNVIDGWTGGTSLSIAGAITEGSVVEALHAEGFTWAPMFWGFMGGSIAETSVFFSIIGAIILIGTGVASWRIMVSAIGTMLGVAALLNLIPEAHSTPYLQLPFYYHLVMGSFVWGVVYMATDPVSSAASTPGKWIYGVSLGLLVLTHRIANPAFTEGTLLAILFMNVMSPLIDHYVVQAHVRKRQTDIQARRLSYAAS